MYVYRCRIIYLLLFIQFVLSFPILWLSPCHISTSSIYLAYVDMYITSRILISVTVGIALITPLRSLLDTSGAHLTLFFCRKLVLTFELILSEVGAAFCLATHRDCSLDPSLVISFLYTYFWSSFEVLDTCS